MQPTVLTDTEMLRAHARDIQHLGDKIRASADTLTDPIDTEVWNNSLNWLLVDDSLNTAIERFRRSYREAHSAACRRVIELAERYDVAAIALRDAADNYDNVDG